MSKEKIDFTMSSIKGGDYVMPVCQDKTTTHPAGTDFTIRLYGGTKFHTSKAGQFLTWYLFRFVYIFF